MAAVRRNAWWLLVFLALPGMVCSESGGNGIALRVDVVDAEGQAVSTFASGEAIHLGRELTNHSEDRVSLPFSWAKTYDLIVLGSDGSEVWRLSEGRMYAQMLSQLDLEPGDSEHYEAACDPTRGGAPALAPGRYQVVGIIPALGAELRSEPVDFVVDASGE
jgi:hypothetical protein